MVRGSQRKSGCFVSICAGSGHPVVKYDFPHKSGTPIGDLIGSFLKGKFGDVTPEFLALAFAVDRLESRTRLLADLEAGSTVICDRFVRSNIAFQRAKIDSDDRRAELEALLIWIEYTLFRLTSSRFGNRSAR